MLKAPMAMNSLRPGDVPPDQVAQYEARPIQYNAVYLPIQALRLGFKGQRIAFDWRPYRDRTEEQQKDYDRLVVSLFHNGMQKPVITHHGHVLIGQRRIEILQRFGRIDSVLCCDVQEDVSQWWQHDVVRLNRLKAQIGEVGY